MKFTHVFCASTIFTETLVVEVLFPILVTLKRGLNKIVSFAAGLRILLLLIVLLCF